MRTRMGFRRHRKSIKSPRRTVRKFVEGVIILTTPSLIDLMSFGWLFLGGLLPSRARLRFTSYDDCATLKSANQNGAAKSKALRLDFSREATNRFRLDYYVRQYGTTIVSTGPARSAEGKSGSAVPHVTSARRVQRGR